MNSDRIPNRWRKQLTRLFLTSQYNWQDLALSTPAASVLKGSAVLLLSQHWGSDNRQVWGNECYWEESRGGKPGSGRTKVIREIINTCIVFFCLFLSLILIPSLWEYIIVVCVCVCVCVSVCVLSHVWLFATPWTIACLAPLFMEFSRQECWSGLPFPLSGYLPNPATEPLSPVLAGKFFTTEPPGKSSH